MSASELDYFEQTQRGESRWWRWIAVTWFTFLGWVFFQSLLLTPIFSIGEALEPGFLARAAELAPPTSAYTQISIFAGLGAGLAWVAALTLDGASRTAARWFAIAGMALCVGLSRMGDEASSGSHGLSDMLSEVMSASPLAFALFLLTFPAALIALYIGQRAVHRRSIVSLHTSSSRIRWGRILEGFAITWIVLGLFALTAQALGIIEIDYVFAGGRFWIFAAVSLLFIPLQAATEEIVFRGYFNQGLAHLTRSKWVAFVLTSLAFMLLHLSNPEALAGKASGELIIVMSGYFFFGFAMCLVVWLDDGLETAIGIHAGNNCFAAIILNYENSVLPTPSVFLTGTDAVKDSVTTVLVLLVLIGIVWWRRGGPPLRARAV